jgi:hypothetical protein
MKTKTKTKAKTKTTKKAKTRAVLVTTEHRGVFFGWTADPADATTVRLTGVRNCLYWTSKTGGFLGLAEAGPLDATVSGNGSRIGSACKGPVTLQKVTCVAEVTPEAVNVWETAPCWGG